MGSGAAAERTLPMTRPAPSQRSKSRTAGDTTKRLRAYALAAVAAGVGLEAVPAGAEIVYTPTNISITRGLLFIDLNADSVNDFVIEDKGFSAPLSRFPLLGGIQLIVGGATSAGVIAQNGGAAVLPPGFIIGSSRTFQDVHQPRLPMAGARNVYAGSYTINVYYYGNWSSEVDRYLGLKFQINGQVHYGWARFSTKSYSVIRHSIVPECCLGRVKATLTGYAYETNPGQSIAAGDTGGAGNGSNAAQGEGTLGTLALGAAAKRP